jgi:hypothetical protein
MKFIVFKKIALILYNFQKPKIRIVAARRIFFALVCSSFSVI